MMEYFVPFEVALKLKELGFKEGCPAIYEIESGKFGVNRLIEEDNFKSHNAIVDCLYLDAPTYNQVIQWLYKNKNYILEIRKNNDGRFCSEIFKSSCDYSFYLHRIDFASDEIGAKLCGIEWILKALGVSVCANEDERSNITLETHAIDLDTI